MLNRQIDRLLKRVMHYGEQRGSVITSDPGWSPSVTGFSEAQRGHLAASAVHRCIAAPSAGALRSPRERRAWEEGCAAMLRILIGIALAAAALASVGCSSPSEEPLTLAVFTGSRAAGEVVLEWTGGAPGVQRWQYRSQGWWEYGRQRWLLLGSVVPE